MNNPDKPLANNTPETVLPAGYAEMIAKSNAKRALGGLAYSDAVREEREQDTAGTFPGSKQHEQLLREDVSPTVINLHNDRVDSEEELDKSVNRHPASKQVPEKREPSVEIEKTRYTNPNYSDAANRRQREADSAYLKSKDDSRSNRGRGPGF